MKATCKCQPPRAGNLHLSGLFQTVERQVFGLQFRLADPFSEVQVVTMHQLLHRGQPKRVKSSQEARSCLARRQLLAQLPAQGMLPHVDRLLQLLKEHLPELEPGRLRQRAARSLHQQHQEQHRQAQHRGLGQLRLSSAPCLGRLRSPEPAFLVQVPQRGRRHQKLYRLQQLAWVLHQQHLQELLP